MRRSKRVFTEISNLLRGSNNWRRGRSYAASVPSDTPKDKKVRKRLSKADRKVMVEAFVDRYRALNPGKFPSASDAYKEVGGSYYVIREIVQELEYKSKNPSTNTSETPFSKEVAKENKPVGEVEEVSSKKNTRDEEMKRKEAQAVAFDNKESEEIRKPKGTCEDSERLATRSHLLKVDADEVLHNSPEKLEDIVKEETPSEVVVDFDSPKPKTEQHQRSPESEKFEKRDSSEKHTDEETEKKSSVWGNLKSLADGIISIWRKL